MSLIQNAVPASLRRPLECSRFAQGLMARSHQSTFKVGPEARAVSLAKSRFARLPQEPEDARITGVTRSLTRRLLALNVPGSLRPESVRSVAMAKIA